MSFADVIMKNMSTKILLPYVVLVKIDFLLLTIMVKEINKEKFRCYNNNFKMGTSYY